MTQNVERVQSAFFASDSCICSWPYVLGKVFRGEDLYAKLRSLKDILGVVSVSAEAYDNALSSSAKDIEDAVQLYSAQEGLSFCVVTRNKKDFIEGVLPVFTPSEFLQTTLL